MVVWCEVGDLTGEGRALTNIGAVYHAQGRYAEALENYQQGLAVLQETGNRTEVVVALTNIGSAYEQAGDAAQAISAYRQAIEIIESIQDNLTTEELLAVLMSKPSEGG